MMLHVLIAMVAGWFQRHQQQVIAYLHEENRVLNAQLGPQRVRLTDTERRRLAVLAYPLGRTRLKEMATLATPDTLMRWYKRLIAQKFDGSTPRTQMGRPPVTEEIEQLVVRMAEENATWGYRRIQGALANLGHTLDKLTVRKDSGVESLLVPPRSPNVNAHCERFVRSIKEEALSQMVMRGERSLSYAIQQYLAHYHHERNHQGLDNQLIVRGEGTIGCQTSHVVRRERLGGLLSYSYREAA